MKFTTPAIFGTILLLAGGCGDTNGRPQIEKTDTLQRAYQFGKTIYENE